ncbi:hypothetical protein [Rhodococcus coprophilus]|nr:hypothetical protein [Rhodococcus coprophilus]MBM7459334.1 hypothetical protein [Rhodococcus coprophilus]
MSMTGDLWDRLAVEVEKLDGVAGRAVHAAVRERAAPLRIQVAGRAGTGRRSVENIVTASVGADSAAEVTGVVVDAPGETDPAFDGDVVVYVLPIRLDPASVHPADRSALARIDARRLVVVAGGPGEQADQIAATLGIGVFTVDDPALPDAVAARLAAAFAHRDEYLVRTVAGIAAVPAARDLIEAAIDAASTSREVA